MLSGIYQTATGLSALVHQQEVIANNLANTGTQGFKQELSQIWEKNTAQLAVSAGMDLHTGPVQFTGAPAQLALTGKGYFTVQTPEGKAYTRDGGFQLDAQGRLVTACGAPVLGQQGEIMVGTLDFSVNAQGEVRSKQEVVDILQISQGEGPMLRLGNGLLTWEDPASIRILPPEEVQVLQGASEGSNVDMVKNMVDLMAVVRMYEANQQAMLAQDEALKQAVTQVGRLG